MSRTVGIARVPSSFFILPDVFHADRLAVAGEHIVDDDDVLELFQLLRNSQELMATEANMMVTHHFQPPESSQI